MNLSSSSKSVLLSWSQGHSVEYRYVLRSRILLMLDEGLKYEEIQLRLGTSSGTISKWKRRYEKRGIEGLRDLPRSGKPPVYDEAMRARIVQKACDKPEGGYSNWSQDRIAKELGVSQSTVFRSLKKNVLKPHKVEYWCGKSPDPEFESKMLNIVGLYMNPPENALVLSVDEKTQMQALDRTQPELPMKSGLPRRQTATYKRHGTVSLIAALAVQSGEITANTMESNNSDNFLKFLKKLDRTYRHKHLHIIVDNLSVHKNKEVKHWLEKKKRKITMHFTPTYASWLNQIEIWFGIMTKDVLKNAVWKSKEHLNSQIMHYIKTYNATRAAPFSWQYDGK